MLINLSNLHHAYLLIGSAEEAESLLHDSFGNLIGSPDFFVFKEPTFGVDDARKVSEAAIRKAFGEKKIFFIAPEKITLEAQNALLKAFEEPIPDTHFFLCLRDDTLVLPTLRSRMVSVRLKPETSDDKAVEKFLNMSIKDRLNFVKKFVDNEENLSVFLDDLLYYLRKGSVNTSSLEKVYQVRLLSDDRGVAPRLILEHLSLVL